MVAIHAWGSQHTCPGPLCKDWADSGGVVLPMGIAAQCCTATRKHLQ